MNKTLYNRPPGIGATASAHPDAAQINAEIDTIDRNTAAITRRLKALGAGPNPQVHAYAVPEIQGGRSENIRWGFRTIGCPFCDAEEHRHSGGEERVPFDVVTRSAGFFKPPCIPSGVVRYEVVVDATPPDVAVWLIEDRAGGRLGPLMRMVHPSNALALTIEGE